MPHLHKWDPQWNTGVAVVDEEHRKLFNMFMVFNDAWDVGYGFSILGSMLTEVLDYTNYHFQHEEEELQKRGYAGLEEHRIRHQQLRQQALEYQKRFMQGGDRDRLGLDVALFLQNWLIHHIQEMDLQAFRG